MNNAYQTMKAFWLDVKNLQHKKEVPQLGTQKICVAGVEMAALDANGAIKHLMIAASSLGNASVYFENNSPSGIGGFTGGTSGPVHEKANLLLQQAAAVADKLPVVPKLQEQQDVKRITLFTASGNGELRAQDIAEAEVRNPAHPLYAFFAYTQQVLGAFRTEQAAAQKTAPMPNEKTNKS